ncbi:MAG: FG-GAP-like repeat-containing protein, partial [Chitinophagaceae bacterium]
DKQNPFAIGSKIKVYKGRTVFYRELSPSRGFQSSVDHKLLIGVGTTKAVDSLVITWPDHSRTSYTNPSLNQLHVLTKPPARGKQFQETPPAAGAVFTDLSGMFNKHQEDEYVDFYYERNLPQMLSRGGPRIATGDVNADGLEDIYIGGGRGQLRLLYLQTPQGRFIKKTEQAFAAYQDFEDAALLFFDADGDKDLDLFIGAGGNRSGVGSREMQHRLFFNDGKGNFTINTLSFPNNDMNIGAAAAHDYDTDGDVDLFIGGRSVPYAYGVSAQSVLYENNGSGIFKDVTPSVNKYLHTIGMVTSALWADVAGDKTKELIVSGEWMTTRIFTVSNKTLMELPRTGLENLHGWWQSLTTADVNNDGALDLVIGNIGENFYLKPGPTKPAKLWIADYDNNGERESFFTQT